MCSESGVFKDDSCQKGVTKFEGCGSDSNANHCISLVGWGFDTAVNLPYWILRNEVFNFLYSWVCFMYKQVVVFLFFSVGRRMGYGRLYAHPEGSQHVRNREPSRLCHRSLVYNL